VLFLAFVMDWSILRNIFLLPILRLQLVICSRACWIFESKNCFRPESDIFYNSVALRFELKLNSLIQITVATLELAFAMCFSLLQLILIDLDVIVWTWTSVANTHCVSMKNRFTLDRNFGISLVKLFPVSIFICAWTTYLPGLCMGESGYRYLSLKIVP